MEGGCGATCDDLVITDTAGLSYIDRDSPQMHQFVDTLARRYPGGEKTGHTLAAWVGMQLLAHVLAAPGDRLHRLVPGQVQEDALDLLRGLPHRHAESRVLGQTPQRAPS